MKLMAVKDKVEKILTESPEARDNDNLLILKVWAMQNPHLRNKKFTFVTFSRGYVDGFYHPAESIRRVRQALQKEFPKLRGKKYEERHKHQESIKEELNSPEMKAGGTP
jgi:hypothetical protein